MKDHPLATRIAVAAFIFLVQVSIAEADEVSVSLITNITGTGGETITVLGNLTNTTSSTEYFGNDAINLAAPNTVATASDDIIVNGLLGSGPTSIAAGATLTNVDLFSVQFLGGAGSYTGNTFQLFGGTDAVGCANGAADCNTLLGTATFSLTETSPVPLPATAWLFISGLGLLSAIPRKLHKQHWRSLG
jgi:hypothetical protein